MKNITPILAGTVLLTLLSACNKTEAPGSARMTPAAKPISFQACIPSTKAEGGGSSPVSYLDDFGVFAYHTKGLWSESAQPNFMFNQKVIGNGAGSYTYSPVKYWPGGTDDYVTFFAYAPYATSSNGISIVSSNTSAGLPKIKYTLPADEADKVDLLNATPEENLGPADGKVHFNFEHSLARIGFLAQIAANGWDQQNSRLYINQVTVTAKVPSYATLELGTGEWSDASAPAARRYVRSFGEGDQGFLVKTNKLRLNSENQFILLIPADNAEVSIEVRYTLITADSALPGGKIVNEYTRSSTQAIPLQSGHTYDFTFLASPAAIVFDAPNVSEWSYIPTDSQTISLS